MLPEIYSWMSTSKLSNEKWSTSFKRHEIKQLKSNEV